MMLAWLAACAGSDPELAVRRRVLDQWTAAEARIEAGEPEAARALLEEALAARPEDPILLAWSAKASADAGDLDDALARIDRALASRPEFAEARYNRAAWLARAGRPAEAGPELERALRSRVRPAREVLADPDFTAWLGHPAFAFLPREALSVVVEAPDSSAFWGSEVPFRLRVLGATTEPVIVTGGVGGPVEVVHGVEERRPSADGPVYELTWQLRVVGAGEATVGPLVVTAGASAVEVAAVRFPCEAPPGKTSSETRMMALRSPGDLAGGWAVPSATRSEALVWVKTGPGDRVVLDPSAGPPVTRLERRENGVLAWTATAWRTGPVEVRVLRAGVEALRETVR